MAFALPAALAFVLVSFSLNSVVTRYVVAGDLLDPGLATAVRFVAGALSLLVALGATGRIGSARPTRGNVLPAFWLGAYALLISYGYVHIGAAAGTFVFYASVLGTMTMYGAWVDRRPPAPWALAGGFVALAGVGILALGRTEGTTLVGVLLLAGTGVSWGAYSVLGRRHPDALAFTGANFLALALVLVPGAGLLLAGAADPVGLTLHGVAWAAGMGAVTTALSYVAWYWALARIGNAQGATYQLAIPVLTGFLGVGWLGEPLTPQLFGGGALVLAGMALATPRRARAQTEAPVEAVKRA